MESNRLELAASHTLPIIDQPILACGAELQWSYTVTLPCFEPDPTLLKALEGVRAFLNSTFISAFLSALAGAGLGVWGAQTVTERSTRRKELLDALRQANALVVLASTISNQALTMKNQHIAPLCETYFEERKAAESVNETILKGGRLTESTAFKAEMVYITPLTVPLDALKNIAYSAQLIPGRALALVAMVEQSLTEMEHAIGVRTKQIESFKARSVTQELSMQDYFGLKRRDGDTDSLYHDSMVAIREYTDDVAFFSAELADEVQAHGFRIQKRLVKLAKVVPEVSTVDFSDPRGSGLMPPKEKYETWLVGFRSKG
jgi:hypothetical protein